MHALKERHGGGGGHGMANGGVVDAADGRHQGAPLPASGAATAAAVSLSGLMGAVQRLGVSVPGASHLVESLGAVAESKDFQNAYKLNQKVRIANVFFPRNEINLILFSFSVANLVAK